MPVIEYNYDELRFQRQVPLRFYLGAERNTLRCHMSLWY